MSDEFVKIALDTVGRIKITFNIIIHSDSTQLSGNKKTIKPTISKYYYDGMHYIHIAGSPFVKLDFSSRYEKKTQGFNRNMYLTLRRIDVYLFRKSLSKFLTLIHNHESEIYMNDPNSNDIIVNNSIANAIAFKERINGKAVILRPSVIKPEGIDSLDTVGEKGFVMYVNNISDYIYITLDELDYLYYVMRNINMYDLMTNAINIYLQMKDVKVEKKKVDPISEPNSSEYVEESKPQEGFFKKVHITENSIPDI